MALSAACRRGRCLPRALAAPLGWPPPPPAPRPGLGLGTRPAPPPAARLASSAARGAAGGGGPQRKVVVVRITSPALWLRTRFCYLLIRLYFDPDFSVEEFTRGAKQAFSLVSKLLSQRKLDLLEELVSEEKLMEDNEGIIESKAKEYMYGERTAVRRWSTLKVLKEKISVLPDSHRDALAAELDAIMYTTEGDVRIYYDDDGRKFVRILMRFWYLNGANLPDEIPGEAKVFQIMFGDENTKEKKHLLTANYEFQREFTEGAKPDWTITRIEHPKLLE